MRSVVLAAALEDAGRAGALHLELAARGIDSWPAGPEIAARYSSGELVARLGACNGLVVLATPAAGATPFLGVEVRLARELGRASLVVTLDLPDDMMPAWVGPTEGVAVRSCADIAGAAAAIEAWTPPAQDLTPAVVRFGAARSTLLRVASHGGRISEATAAGLDRDILQTAALHLRSIGLIDFSGPLDDDRTTLITVS